MKAFLIPAIFAAVGTGSGIAAAMILQKPEADLPLQADTPCGDVQDPVTARDAAPDIGPAREYARLNNQFIIPIVEGGRVVALIVMSLNVEVTPGNAEAVFAAEPKLRDGFLQNMFNHANIGGFSGNFTQGTNMRNLRNDLLQTAQNILGSAVTDILITDIVRQDS
ncbi:MULTISPECIES: flagellar basal body-associated FliL family protein [unclassified Yoonia]|uniref:flagellar basal body-associated FliL family protein n=1 Tax=unclassified Yoonia TaxID=2629118 RepID=UPI002AFE24A2|nr:MULTISPECIES: flagellar basal body-associated FliL family protein [unclassified Yoonia]